MVVMPARLAAAANILTVPASGAPVSEVEPSTRSRRSRAAMPCNAPLGVPSASLGTPVTLVALSKPARSSASEFTMVMCRLAWWTSTGRSLDTRSRSWRVRVWSPIWSGSKPQANSGASPSAMAAAASRRRATTASTLAAPATRVPSGARRAKAPT